ncbi:ABC transporter substrate-binding protein [Celeribacter sp. PS-C1]|uniref:ABC transporter substrate-binding protein n=1 Tax=Celeribacter sp. PS-C1 TaxID=2820813 RepID=UPI001C67EF41|nr:ABC transporter substrate-binding protein [Celeribacter sp. PS-C1]MBW6417035.1 ABC transporter substrate-binding protein [Celeribacter sp. PS-C1]
MKYSVSMLALGLVFATSAVSAQELTIAGFGGKVQEDLSRTLWQPAAEAAGLTLRQESHDGMAGVRVQVQSGNPGWDIVHMGADQCAVGEKAGIFEPLDYNVIDASGVPDEAKGDNWIGINSYSVVLAYNTEKYGDNPPQSWSDFWDTETFPGRRSLGVYPQEMMEIALMADGVAKEDLYPLDTDRALDALSRIQPSIDVWWTSGAQSAQLVADGEVDMLAIWGSRVTGVIENGAPVAFTYNQGILGNGCLAVLKGSDNVEAAQRFIAGVVAPETQADIPKMMPYYGPTNQKAFEVGNFSEEVLAASNTAPENAAKQVIIDVNWWADNAPLVQEDYKMMMVE